MEATAATLQQITALSDGAEFRAYVADLAAYNSGRLIGAWIALDGLDADEIRAAVSAVIAASPFLGAEEYAIHDWDGIPSSFGEWPDWDAVAAYVGAMADLDDSDREAFAAYIADIGASVDSDSLDGFREAYNGCHRSGEDFAAELADEIGAVPESPVWPCSHIDWEAAWRDLEICGDYWGEHGAHGFHVFRNL